MFTRNENDDFAHYKSVKPLVLQFCKSKRVGLPAANSLLAAQIQIKERELTISLESTNRVRTGNSRRRGPSLRQGEAAVRRVWAPQKFE